MIDVLVLRPHRSKANLAVTRNLLGPLAQSVEQQTFNLWVVGSIPTGPTILFTVITIYFDFVYAAHLLQIETFKLNNTDISIEG